MIPTDVVTAKTFSADAVATVKAATDVAEDAEEEELNMAYATYERKLAKAKEIAIHPLPVPMSNNF